MSLRDELLADARKHQDMTTRIVPDMEYHVGNGETIRGSELIETQLSYAELIFAADSGDQERLFRAIRAIHPAHDD